MGVEGRWGGREEKRGEDKEREEKVEGEVREGSKRGRVRIQQTVASSLWSLHIISTLQGTSRNNCALY